MIRLLLKISFMLLPALASAERCPYGLGECDAPTVLDNRGIANLYAQPAPFQLMDLAAGREGYCLSTDGVYTYESFGCSNSVARSALEQCRNANSWHQGSTNRASQCRFLNCVNLKRAIQYCAHRDRGVDFNRLKNGIRSGTVDLGRGALAPGELCGGGSCLCANGTLVGGGAFCN